MHTKRRIGEQPIAATLGVSRATVLYRVLCGKRRTDTKETGRISPRRSLVNHSPPLTKVPGHYASDDRSPPSTKEADMDVWAVVRADSRRQSFRRACWDGRLGSSGHARSPRQICLDAAAGPLETVENSVGHDRENPGPWPTLFIHIPEFRRLITTSTDVLDVTPSSAVLPCRWRPCTNSTPRCRVVEGGRDPTEGFSVVASVGPERLKLSRGLLWAPRD